MPKVSGVFEQFKDIDLIPIDDIVGWLKPAPNLYFLENYIANLIFYPQIIPDTEEEINIELAILREVLKRSPNFYDPRDRKIVIPAEFIIRFPDITKLIWAIIDGIRLNEFFIQTKSDINKIVLAKKDYQVNLGTILSPQFHTKSDGLFNVDFDEQPDSKAVRNYNVKQGTLIIVPCLKSKCKLTFKSKDAKLMGKDDSSFEVVGGEIGIVLDGRGQK